MKRIKKNEKSFEGYYLPRSISYILRPIGLKRLIDNDLQWKSINRPEEKPDQVIGKAIKFYTDCIEYAWPRYLSAFDRIYNFVRVENGVERVEFDVVIAKLEYGSSEKHQILLREAGVPFEIIQKIGSVFSSCETPEELYKMRDRADAELKRILSGIEYRVLGFYI